jgi:rRNA processing protein Gar1
VVNISSRHNIILQAENVPHLGSEVVDENLRHIGKVCDVFGPTSRPYVVVKPKVKPTKQLVRSVLYTIPSRESRREKIG